MAGTGYHGLVKAQRARATALPLCAVSGAFMSAGIPVYLPVRYRLVNPLARVTVFTT